MPVPVHGEETFGLPSSEPEPQQKYFTREQLLTALKPYDFNRNGTVTPDHARYALKQLKMLLTSEVEQAIK